MAKTKVSEWDSTASGNTDINGININEGCPPSTINNAIREAMAQVKDLVDGSSGDSLTNSGTLTSSGTLAVTGGVTLDGAAGTSGQYLTSAGSGNTPTWTTLSLGTMSSQNANAVNITGGTISGVTISGITDLTVADGGTGVSTIAANSVVLGNGTSPVQTVAPSTSGNVLTSNGTTWTSAAAGGGIGVGQTWTDVSGSRVVGTTYTNSTGKPIMVGIYLDNNAPTTSRFILSVNGIDVNGSGGTAGGQGGGLCTIVPDGSTYRVYVTAGTIAISTWAELR